MADENAKQSDKIEFLAYLPPIQTALTISGDGDLLRIKLDCNLSVSPDAARLLIMTGKRLKVTVEELTAEIEADEIRKQSKRERTRNPYYNKA